MTTGEGFGRTTTDIEYTASGQRVVEKSSAPNFARTRFFIGDLYERIETPSAGLTEHRYKVLVGSRQVAEVVRRGTNDTNPGVFYLHDDHLGSTTLITGAGGDVAETRSYEAFGAVTASTTSASTGVLSSYTGHNDDSALGLVNARGRLYDAKLGRFVSPDPFTSNPASSQGWNRYAYVENNPLAFTDPSGFYCVGDNYGGTPYWQCTANPWEEDEEQARADAEAERRQGQSSGQSTSDAAANAAQAQAEGQRASEDAQRGFEQGEAGAAAGQPPPGGPTLAPPLPDAPNPSAIPNQAFAPKVGNSVLSNQNFKIEDTSETWETMLVIVTLPGAPELGLEELAAELLGWTARALPAASRTAKLTQGAVEHIALRHFPTSGATGAGKFATTSLRELRGLISDTVARGAARPNTLGRPGTIIELNFGRQIGTNVAGEAATSLRVVVTPEGVVKTAFPF